jgi:hypothetical protein
LAESIAKAIAGAVERSRKAAVSDEGYRRGFATELVRQINEGGWEGVADFAIQPSGGLSTLAGGTPFGDLASAIVNMRGVDDETKAFRVLAVFGVYRFRQLDLSPGSLGSLAVQGLADPSLRNGLGEVRNRGLLADVPGAKHIHERWEALYAGYGRLSVAVEFSVRSRRPAREDDAVSCWLLGIAAGEQRFNLGRFVTLVDPPNWPRGWQRAWSTGVQGLGHLGAEGASWVLRLTWAAWSVPAALRKLP